MKSELRTELKSNLLADRLEEIVLAIKPHLKLIGFGIAAIGVASVVYGLMHTRNEKASANAWSDFYFAANREDKLDEVSLDFPTKSAGLWAKQKSADALMSKALEQVYVDRDLADKLLSETVDAYRSVLAKAQEPMLVCRATYGLAQALDSQGNAAEASKEFKKVLSLPGAHSDMIADAQRRIQFIESDEGRNFYEWFKTNRPTAPKPVDIPKDLGKLPSDPDLQFNTPAVAPPVTSNTTVTPAESTPAESTPADTGSALQMPPADKAPTTDSTPEKSTIVEPPAEKPAPETPKAETPKAEEEAKAENTKPEKAKSNDKSKKAKKKKDPDAPKPDAPKGEEPLTLPDSEPAASDKKAGGS
jgi:hypothetical protein